MNAALAGGTPHRRGPLSILLCIPERHILRLTQVNLSREGHFIEATDNVADALAFLASQKFDLFIIDQMLPDSGWRELYDSIKEDKANAEAPVIVLARLHHAEQIEDIYKAGVNLVVTVPFNPAELINHLK